LGRRFLATPVTETSLPSWIESDPQLEELLSRPSPSDVALMQRLDGDIAVLGAGGKMGPSLVRRARRAADQAGQPRRIVAVARFTSASLQQELRSDGIETLKCDLLDPKQVAGLPDVPNVLFLAGMKFGSSARPDLTWALNTVVPANVARRFSGSRIVAFSTGNVYPLVAAVSGGCSEADAPGPVGEYAQSCLGRERIFEHYSAQLGTPCLLLRLFYAVDLRYGVLVDVARKVYAGEAIDLSVAHFNTIWQGDANSCALRGLELCSSPPRVLNVTGPDAISVRSVAAFFGRRFSREARFRGDDGPRALLGRTALCTSLMGPPQVGLEQLLEWTARWVESGGKSLGKPTRYESADGRF
jgi:nucleoside-diphosphate-sugar epimerase